MRYRLHGRKIALLVATLAFEPLEEASFGQGLLFEKVSRDGCKGGEVRSPK